MCVCFSEIFRFPLSALSADGYLIFRAKGWRLNIATSLASFPPYLPHSSNWDMRILFFLSRGQPPLCLSFLAEIGAIKHQYRECYGASQLSLLFKSRRHFGTALQNTEDSSQLQMRNAINLGKRSQDIDHRRSRIPLKCFIYFRYSINFRGLPTAAGK